MSVVQWHAAARSVASPPDGMAQHSTAQHSTAQHSTAQHSTAQHSTAQHSTSQHITAQRSPALFNPSSLQMFGQACNSRGLYTNSQQPCRAVQVAEELRQCSEEHEIMLLERQQHEDRVKRV